MNPRFVAYAPQDLQGVLDVLAAGMPADPISQSRFVRQVLLDANLRADGAIVAHSGDQVVGFCLALARQLPLENAPPDSDRGYITLFAVHPKFQRQGIGSGLLQQAESYLRAQGRKLCMIAPYAPGYFICGVDVKAYESGLNFFLKHGFTEVYRPIAMEIPLWSWSYPEWVTQKRIKLEQAGVTIEHYRPELTLPLLEFAAQEFAGDWVRVYRETMGRIALGDAPSRIIVAHENYKVLGFSHHDNERFGPIGVAAAERGRGLGHVLMYETLRAQRQAGFRTAWFLWSDDKTAQRLYSAAGFREVRRFAILKKELSAENPKSDTRNPNQ
jgi:ribosomal protein S18 acetylase RimI-like enzyme